MDIKSTPTVAPSPFHFHLGVKESPPSAVFSRDAMAKIMMSLFYGRPFQDSLINGMDPKLLKEEMVAVYERVKG